MIESPLAKDHEQQSAEDGQERNAAEHGPIWCSLFAMCLGLALGRVPLNDLVYDDRSAPGLLFSVGLAGYGVVLRVFTRRDLPAPL